MSYTNTSMPTVRSRKPADVCALFDRIDIHRTSGQRPGWLSVADLFA